MIELALTISDKDGTYARHAGAVLASIFQRSDSRYNVHILHDDTLNEDNMQKLTLLIKRWGHDIHFYSITLSPGLETALSHISSLRLWTTASFYRILLPHVLDAEKVIYLDCDVFVNLDLAELWSVDIGERYLAAVWDQGIMGTADTVTACGLNPETYFNSGVILFHLNNMRTKPWHAEALRFVQKYPQIAMPDQDTLNALYGNNYHALDWRFNLFLSSCPDLNFDNRIIHFSGPNKWWLPESPGWAIYQSCLAATPWSEQADILHEYRQLAMTEQAGTPTAVVVKPIARTIKRGRKVTRRRTRSNIVHKAAQPRPRKNSKPAARTEVRAPIQTRKSYSSSGVTRAKPWTNSAIQNVFWHR